jgi:membrane associated rhomboid family serine protease
MRRYSDFNLNALWFLIAANVLVFLIELIVGGWPITSSNEVIRVFGLTPALLLNHPWTIITNLFVHGGFLHILFNMISLYFLGSFLLRLVGEKNFFAVYFAGGVLGNVLFYVLLKNSEIPGIGASGAIFALGGALTMIAPRVRVLVFPVPVPMPLWAAMVLFLVISFFVAGIAWQAHLGGFLFGLLAGYYLRRKRRTYYL